jgi:hypothetical protein
VAAEGFHLQLDYSVQSVQVVDKILAAIHEDVRRNGRQDGLDGLGLEFGAYITYVIDRNFTSGTFRPDSPAIGQGTFPFEWNGETIFPVAWCLKQILNGDEDSVWVKFQALVVRRWAGKAG